MKARRTLRGGALFVAGALVAVIAVTAIQAFSAVPRRYSPYRKLGLFARVLTYVENNYVHHVDGKKLVHGAIRGMLKTLDPHSVFMPPDVYRRMKADTRGSFGGLGIEVEVRNNWLTIVAPIEDTPAHRAGLKSGDEIRAIDGKTTRGMQMTTAVRRMRGPRGTRVKLTILRHLAPVKGKPRSKTFDVEIVRDVIKVVSVRSKALASGIAYVRVKSFQERTAAYLRKAIEQLRAKAPGKKLRGLILDLRNNPGGLLEQAVKVADLFITDGLIVKTTGKGGRVLDREKAHSRGTFTGFPMVCLVNGGSASASEIVAGALQDHKRAVVLGQQTFGKGSVQTIIELRDGSGLKLTIARYYTPSGRSIQERGIEPDIVVQSKAPPAKKEKVTREKDLRGHLRGSPTKRSKKPKRRKRLEDFQLQTALDYLRAAQIFRASK